MSKKLLYGADPEYFATEPGTDNVIPPIFFRKFAGASVEVVNGAENHPIFFKRGKAFIHEDGAAFEMSLPPRERWQDLWDDIQDLKNAFDLSAYPFVEPKLKALPTATWQVERWLETGDDDFKFCTRFGCDRDEDAFLIEEEQDEEDASLHPFRYAGGHAHFSGLEIFERRPLDVVRGLAFTAGICAMLYSDTPKEDKLRVYRYGKPGKFRVQHYSNGAVGIEYRTPSTRWTDNKELAQKIFEAAQYCFYELVPSGRVERIYSDMRDTLIAAFRGMNKSVLSDILKEVMV
jgi:hypothetical protein